MIQEDNKDPKKRLARYYIVALILILVGNFLILPAIKDAQIEQVGYNKFIEMTLDKKVGEVKIEDNRILFTNKDKTKTYKTAKVEDSGLTERLYK